MRFGPFLSWDVLALAFTGIVIMALAAWVYFLKPGDIRHRAFGLYLFLYGTADALQALPFVDLRDKHAIHMVVALTFLTAMWALARFLLVYPRPRLTAPRQRLVLMIVGVALAGLGTAMLLLHDAGMRYGSEGPDAYTPWALPWGTLTSAGFALAPLVFSLDLLKARGEKERSALRLVTVACLVWPMYDLTTYGMYLLGVLPVTTGGATWVVTSYVWQRFAVNVLALAAAVNLMRGIRRHDKPMLPWFLAVAIGPVIALARVAFGFEGYAIGFVDLFLPTFVTIAILRGELFGLDVKLRFAIKTSTVAAVFLGVLFVVANIAQNYLGGQYGVVVGGAAAGLLFFAIAPIQRVAERLAQKAVPVASTSPPVPVPADPAASAGASGKEEAYRAALRLALRDRKLTRDEELGLAHLSDELGLTHKRARELWHQVEGRGRSR